MAILSLATMAIGILPGCHGMAPMRIDVGAPSRATEFAGAMAPSAARHVLGHRPRLTLLISTTDRTLWVIDGTDTLYQAPVAVASGLSLVYADRSWRFQTPNGERRVVRKVANPIWTPPDWHYAEAAVHHGLRLARLPASGVTLTRGRRLEIRNGAVAISWPGSGFHQLPLDEHIVFDGTLFIPPVGTRNRQLAGDLGRFALDLGEGYLIHGTTDESSIGEAITHGCIRVGDDDLAWLYANVPVGTRVVIR